MKKLFSLILLTIFVSVFSQNKETRTFQQISDSILREAHVIYRYDHAFSQTMTQIEQNRLIRKSAGEILVYPKGDRLFSIVFDSKDKQQVIAEFNHDSETDTAAFVVKQRPATEEELNFYEMKHKVMDDVKAGYNVPFPKSPEYMTPVFFPFTERYNGKIYHLYKLYLITETNQPFTVPFGQDFMFIANNKGKVIYHLQFNSYMPTKITPEAIEMETIEIEYPEREPVLTPTDIVSFNKFATQHGLIFLKMHSTTYNVFFNYDWERETLDVTDQ